MAAKQIFPKQTAFKVAATQAQIYEVGQRRHPAGLHGTLGRDSHLNQTSCLNGRTVQTIRSDETMKSQAVLVARKGVYTAENGAKLSAKIRGKGV